MDPINTALHAAVRSGDQIVAQECLDRGANVNSTDARCRTPLHLAAKKQHLHMVHFLLERGAALETQLSDIGTPLHYAARIYSFDTDQARLRSVEVAQILLRWKANIDSVDREDFTPLHVACFWENTPMVRFLTSQGASVETRDYLGRTPLFYTNWNEESMAILVKCGANINAEDDNGWTPLHEACSSDEIRDSIPAGPARLLLQNGAFVNAKTRDGRTPLHEACANGFSEQVDDLLQNGALVDAKDQGNTPLLEFLNFFEKFTQSFFTWETARILIEYGAAVNTPDTNGCTPLHRAVYLNAGVEVLRQMVEHGANINALDNDGWPVLGHVADDEEMDRAHFLLQRGANGWLALWSAANLGREELKLLWDLDNIRVHSPGFDIRELLWVASANNHTNTARFLLDRIANVESTSTTGATLLHRAASSGNIFWHNCYSNAMPMWKRLHTVGRHHCTLPSFTITSKWQNYSCSRGVPMCTPPTMWWLEIALGLHCRRQLVSATKT